LGQNTSHSKKPEVQLAQPTQPIAVSPAAPAEAASAVAAASDVTAASTVADTSNFAMLPLDHTLTLPAEPATTGKSQPVSPKSSKLQESTPTKPPLSASNESLLQQRLDATRKALSSTNHGNVSIQLFYTDDIRPERMERFLARSQKLGKFTEIYIVPIKLNGKDGYRVLCGLYAGSDTASAGMKELPQRYKDAFAPTLYLLEDSQKTP
jgi:hypothetical protein